MSISSVAITVSAPGIAAQTVAIVPSSFVFDEGTPEGVLRAALVGQTVSQDFSENYENAFSMCKFSIYPTVDNIELARKMESAKNQLTITATGREIVNGLVKQFTRTFANASCSKAEKPIGSDKVIELECKSDAAV
jgi:hypothetical protein